MVTDLVTELRQMAATGYAGCAIWAEAADEIEHWQQKALALACLVDEQRIEIERLNQGLSAISSGTMLEDTTRELPCGHIDGAFCTDACVGLRQRVALNRQAEPSAERFAKFCHLHGMYETVGGSHCPICVPVNRGEDS